MIIHIKTPCGGILTLMPKVTDTIKNIKAMIQDKKQISVDQQQLMLDGKQLENSSTLLGCNMKANSELHLECKYG